MIEALRSIVGIPATDGNLEYILAGAVLCFTLYGLITIFKIFGKR